ncbi:MAG: diguanylate cyclase (GGDEF)-like protein [Flavobacteriales bacterium]|jgi:diguanylate cyclase (GGDEF)-like protein
MKILVVDDDAVDRETVKRALRNNPKIKQLTEAESFAQGLAEVNKNDYDVLVVDYYLPDKNGIDLVIELRSKPNLGNTAIVVVSNSDDEDLALECLQFGAQDFITKSEITAEKLKRAFIQAQKRFELERKLYDSFCQVRELAKKDSLTGLSNRYHFEESLKVSIANNLRSQDNIALLLLDLDHFKNINDTYGHETGDKLLKSVANRITQCLRGNELFARLGGDEFAILITGLKQASKATIVARRIIESLKKPIEINGRNLQCGVSIGAALHPQNADSAEALTKYADIAMYRAKKEGRNRLCYFETEMQEQFSRNYLIENELKEAIVNQDFQLLYQPVVDAVSNNIVGVEALIRWPNCSVKCFPDEFIPIAEQSRLIDKMGEWVLTTAIKQLSVWHQKFGCALTMAVNISAVQLDNVLLVTAIESTLKKHQMSAEFLVLELTETALLAQDENNNKHIIQLCELGCKLALDDFGTGFSSLSHLVNFPINIVKLDKSLLPTSDADVRRLKIVKGIAAMVNIIELHIVVEGVETEFQRDLCQDLNVDELQGYFFDKPMTADNIEQLWLNKC